jgi:hypothetical protein
MPEKIKKLFTRTHTKNRFFCFLTAFGQTGKMLLFLHIFELNFYCETVPQEKGGH